MHNAYYFCKNDNSFGMLKLLLCVIVGPTAYSIFQKQTINAKIASERDLLEWHEWLRRYILRHIFFFSLLQVKILCLIL